MTDVYLAPGVRTPFVKSGGAYAALNGLALSVPVAKAMAARARPDFLVWGQVIPDQSLSNIARELVFEAGLDPTIPAFSTVLACSSSFVGAISTAGMIGRGGTHLALVGGVETMSHVPIALAMAKADAIIGRFAHDPAGAAGDLAGLTAADFVLPIRGWTNRVSGRSQGEHTEDTARRFDVGRVEQDRHALSSHQGVIAGQDNGFFADLIVPFCGVDHDTIARRDTSLEKLAALPPAFDRTSGLGTLTAGNSSPV
ncbi:MAG TPA: beta-ketoacyl synthase N-terminal-like domain-containing protein, partial [Caulobacteraceae bacterium]